MSAYYPPTQSPMPASRPATATAGAIIAIVLTSLSLVGTLISAAVILGNHWLMTGLAFVGARGTVIAFILLGIAVCGLGLCAGIQTLRNSNPWRITTVVFGYLVALFALFGAIGSFSERETACSTSSYGGRYIDTCSHHASNTGGGVVALIWAALAALSATLLLVNGANKFYSNAKTHAYPYVGGYVQQPAYSPATDLAAPVAPIAPVAAPAGWYPVDAGKLRWWDGGAWTEHFHDPTT